MIRIRGELEGAPVFEGTAPAYIRYDTQGRLHDNPHGAGIDFRFKPGECQGKQARRIQVEKLGGASVSVVDCY